MTRIVILCTVCIMAFVRAYAQDGLINILKTIEQNNLELRILQQIAGTERLANRANNNMADPTIGYVHLWDKEDHNITEDELTIEQSFLFPSLYFSQRDLNKLKSLAISGRYDIGRQEILLQAEELCLDIILLRQQQSLLQMMHRNTKDLCDIYCNKLEKGDVCEFEVNKIRLELLNATTRLEQNRIAMDNRLKDLQLINGNIPIIFEDTVYPTRSMSEDTEQMKNKIMDVDLQLRQYEYESAISEKENEISKRQWLPTFALGYRRTSSCGCPANGFQATMSVPIFSNRFMVKIAELQSESITMQKERLKKSMETEISKQYDEALSLLRFLTAYQKHFEERQNCNTLRIALEKGQINMTDYFVELNEVFAVQLETKVLENQYQKVLANLYKYTL